MKKINLSTTIKINSKVLPRGALKGWEMETLTLIPDLDNTSVGKSRVLYNEICELLHMICDY